MESKEVFESVTDVAEKLNCKTVETIARVCRGERPTFQGLHYAFLDENNNPILDKIRLDAPKKHKKHYVWKRELFLRIVEKPLIG